MQNLCNSKLNSRKKRRSVHSLYIFDLPGMLLLKKIVRILFTGMPNSTHFLLQRPKYLRPFGKIYQAINADTLRAQNMETYPYFNQVIFARTCCSVLLAFFPPLAFLNPFLCYEAKSSDLGTTRCTLCVACS